MVKNILKNKKVNYVMTLLLLILCPALCIYLSNYILRQGLVVALRYVLSKWKIASIGYFIMFLVSAVITFATRKVALAYLVVGGISVFAAAAHFFKTNFRGEALFPSDIVFASAAGDMFSQFNISLTPAMIMSLIILAVAVVFSALFTLPKINNRYYINLIAAAVFAVSAVFYWNNYVLNTQHYKNMGFYENMNPIDIYYSNTFHTAFLFYVNSTVVPAPDNYGQERVVQLLSEAGMPSKEQTTPDVILILLESYFDPNSLFGLEFTESINENYNAVAQRAVYGNMLSFKYGGGTADVEFNILNQINTTYYTEALSYMNVYGNNKLPSFVHDLKAAGYSTFAMHAYTSQLYNRIKAYSNMGFDGSKFMDTYSNTATYGNYISDISHVEEMIEKYEEYVATGADNIFLYGVSMQNHMYMSQENITDRVYLKDKGYSRSFTDGMGILASYMRQTDMAIKRLYDYFEQVDREVVIILYGDHQSYNIDGLSDFSTESLNEITSYSSMTYKEKYIASHTTPFIIWSNQRDMGGEYWPLISPYNLWALASQSYGLPSREYERYLYQQMQTMPVDNEYAGIWCDRDGKIYDEKPVHISDSIKMMNYDRLFGKQYSVLLNEREV